MFKRLLAYAKKFFDSTYDLGDGRLVIINSCGCHTAMSYVIVHIDRKSNTYVVAI